MLLAVFWDLVRRRPRCLFRSGTSLLNGISVAVKMRFNTVATDEGNTVSSSEMEKIRVVKRRRNTLLEGMVK